MQASPLPQPDELPAPVSDTTGGRPGSVVPAERRAANQPLDRRAGGARATAAERLLENYLVKRQATVLQLVAELLDSSSLDVGLRSLADALHQQFDCDRVVVGVMRSSRLRVQVISQQASFDQRSNEVALLEDALKEASDQDAIVCYPDADDDTLSTEAHQALGVGRVGYQVLSLPLCHDSEVVGAVLLETSARTPWSRFTLELLTQVAELSAALIALRRDAERGLFAALRRTLRTAAEHVTGPRHTLIKSLAALALLTGVIAAVVPVTHQVNATAEVVPTGRRLVSAPIEGFVDTVLTRVGDRLSKGDILLKLDTRQLSLEQTRLKGEIRGIQTEMRAAMAARDRKESVVLFSRRAQANAALARVQQQLERAVVRSPVDGIVVAGDIDEIVGAPVLLGDALLEIAPLKGQEVHLLVDQSDIGHVAIGQQGALSLISRPGRALAFNVTTIHPIAQAAEGSNRIRVEAALPAGADTPLPGQTGIGKIVVGEASLLWIWTHRFTDWARQRAWEWFG